MAEMKKSTGAKTETRRPGTREVARAAGVSSATVSRALRGDPRISEETRAVVGEAARSLGYAPSPLVAALMHQVRQGNVDGGARIGLLMDGRSRSIYQQEGGNFWLNLEGCRERLAELGYAGEVFFLPEDGESPGCLTRILLARGIHGAVLLPSRWPIRSEQLPKRASFAMATVAFTAPEAAISRASVHHMRDSEQAMTRLRALGHRRIGLTLQRGGDERTGHGWLAGATAFAHYADVAGPTPVLLVGDGGDQGEVPRWIARHRLSAVVTSYDILDLLEGVGLRVPQDVSVAHLDAPAPDGRTPPQYAGIVQEAREVGRIAAEIVAGQLTRHERGAPDHPRMVYIEGAWQDGPSAGPWVDLTGNRTRGRLKRADGVKH